MATRQNWRSSAAVTALKSRRQMADELKVLVGEMRTRLLNAIGMNQYLASVRARCLEIQVGSQGRASWWHPERFSTAISRRYDRRREHGDLLRQACYDMP